MELATLALPAHVPVLARVEESPPMEEEEPIAPPGPGPWRSLSRATPPVAAANKFGVVGQLGSLGIPPVADQGEMQLAFGVGEVVDLEPFNQLVDLVGPRQQRGIATSVRRSAVGPWRNASEGSSSGWVRAATARLTTRHADVGSRDQGQECHHKSPRRPTLDREQGNGQGQARHQAIEPR